MEKSKSIFKSPAEVIAFVEQYTGDYKLNMAPKNREHTMMRHLAMWLIRKKFPEVTLSAIGDLFDRDHSLVTYATKRIDGFIKMDHKFVEENIRVINA